MKDAREDSVMGHLRDNDDVEYGSFKDAGIFSALLPNIDGGGKLVSSLKGATRAASVEIACSTDRFWVRVVDSLLVILCQLQF
jgi:hypothetical protein